MQSRAKSVDEYLAEIPETRRAAFTALRKLITVTAPTAEETMSYGMAVFLIGEISIGLASQKQNMALYCCVEVFEKYRSEFAHLNCGKCCIRFRRIEDLPLDAVEKMVREMAEFGQRSRA